MNSKSDYKNYCPTVMPDIDKDSEEDNVSF